MRISSITNIGLIRSNNEDRFLIRQFDNGAAILTLADGMGGHAAGERAAQIAVDALLDFDPEATALETHLVGRVETAHTNVMETSRNDEMLRGMGTTLTIAFIRGNLVHWAHVGDTRLYLLHGKNLLQVTDDHTIPGVLARRGEIPRDMVTKHPMRNVLLKCVGCETCEPDSGFFQVAEGDLLLMSTDGLHDLVDEDIILSILASDAVLETKLSSLVQNALAAGGRDNVTILAAEV